MAAAFSVALIALARALHHVNPSQVLDYARTIPVGRLSLAIAFTCVSYVTLSSYDYFGLRFAGRTIPFRTSLPASLVAYSLSYNIGFATISGTALKFRLFTTWGLSAFEVAKAAAFSATTFWLGLVTMAGIAFVASPPGSLAADPSLSPAVFRVIGLALLTVPTAYVVLCARRRRNVRVLHFEFALPTVRLALLQIMLSLIDWSAASGVMYTILGVFVSVDYLSFVSIYVLAIAVGAASTVPAGLGVVESVIIFAFAGRADVAALAGGMIIYRSIYYLLPLFVGVGLLAWLEGRAVTTAVRRFGDVAGKWLEATLPVVSASLTFLAGTVLLMSGATPTVAARLRLVQNVLPLAFIEGAQLLGSVSGVLLLLLARGLMKRLSGAYFLTLGLLIGGALFSLSKGFDYEEAAILLLSFGILAPCRSYFYRRSSLLESWASPRWATAVTLVVASSVWLAVFAHENVAYSDVSWWAFAFDRGVPLGLRASFSATVTLLAAGFVYLIRPPRWGEHVATRVTDPVVKIVRASPATYANLALLGDKEFLLNDDETGFIMYARKGSCWIALGDPVGPPETAPDLIWTFREKCDHFDARPVFYQVDAEGLHRYVDAGFDLLKIGEEAIVRLGDLTLSGSHHKDLRNTVNHMERENLTFRLIPSSEVGRFLPEMRAVSEDWLATRGGSEKGFSLGFFSDDYLSRFPAASVSSPRGIEAFANVWTTQPKGELSCDLMRHRSDSPRGVMDFLLVRLMQWGQAEGFHTFNLGMAPLAGVEEVSPMPIWNKLESAIYRYGARWYDFQGLRAYKCKFDPVWRPKYIACPSGLAMPTALLDLAVLIGGGVGRTFLK